MKPKRQLPKSVKVNQIAQKFAHKTTKRNKDRSTQNRRAIEEQKE